MSTTRLGLPDPPGELDNSGLGDDYLRALSARLDEVGFNVVRGTRADRPAAGDARRAYIAVDTREVFIDAVTSWFSLPVLETNGGLKLGGLPVPRAEEQLRIVRGITSSTGSIMAGSGFDVDTDDNRTVITFEQAFTDVPSIQVGLWSASPRLYLAEVDSQSATGFRVVTSRRSDGANVRLGMQFTATGPV